jgi:hypothetical protein
MLPPDPSVSSMDGKQFSQSELETLYCFRNLFSVITAIHHPLISSPSPQESADKMVSAVKNTAAATLCFMTRSDFYVGCRNIWTGDDKVYRRPVLFLVVPNLPRNMTVEWQLLLDKDVHPDSQDPPSPLTSMYLPSSPSPLN